MDTFGIYTRVSGDKQEDNTSHETQEQDCRARLVELGITVNESLVLHETQSGGDWWERGKIQEMIEAIRNGAINGFIAWKLDRVSRNTAHSGYLITELERYDARFELAVEQFDQTPEGNLFLGIKAYVAQSERADFKRRAERGQRARVERGHYPGTNKPPYGYRFRTDTLKPRSELEVDPEHSQIIRIIVSSLLGGMSARAVARKLTAEGISPPSRQNKSGRWTGTALQSMLENPVYLGTPAVHRTNSRLKGGKVNVQKNSSNDWVFLPSVEALITPDELIAIQGHRASLKIESKRNLKATESEMPLLRAGIIRCGECGRKINARRRTDSDKYEYYTGSDHFRIHGCSQFSIMTRPLDDIVWRQVVEALRKPELIIERLNLLREEDPTKGRIELMDRRIADIDSELSNLALSVGKVKHETAIAAISMQMDLLAEQRAIIVVERLEQSELRDSWLRAQQHERDIRMYCEQFQMVADRLSYTNQRKLLQALGVVVSVFNSDHKDVDGRPLRWQISMRLHPESDIVTSSPYRTLHNITVLWTDTRPLF